MCAVQIGEYWSAILLVATSEAFDQIALPRGTGGPSVFVRLTIYPLEIPENGLYVEVCILRERGESRRSAHNDRCIDLTTREGW